LTGGKGVRGDGDVVGGDGSLYYCGSAA